jgi:glycosyltransferase involved in cell wall biosynthesis
METKNKKLIRAVTVSMSVGFYEPMIGELQQEGYEVVSVSSPGPELERLRAKGVRCLEVPMERHIAIQKDIRSLFALIRVFHKEKPFIVHSMTPKAGMLCMVAAWVCRVPRRVHTFTGLVWPTAKGLKRRVLMFTDWLTCFCATHVIPEGQGVKNDLSHITKKPMKVLGYGNVKGVDMHRFSLRPEVLQKAAPLKNKDVFTFIFVGRIVGDKGINELVEAYLRLLKEHSNLRLFLVGNYEMKLDPVSPQTMQCISDTKEISAVGPKYADDLLAYYAASDCFVFPSYREGFPNTVMEAGAMGLPSIVTDINGSREIIVENKNGKIIPSKDVDALYRSMKFMVENEDDRRRMAGNARQMIASRFDQTFVRKCLMDFYNQISAED